MRTKLLAGWLCLLGAMGMAQASNVVERVIYDFGYYLNGAAPRAGLTADANGNRYGTTLNGGPADMGVVFMLNGSSYSVLHSFTGGDDGAHPYAGVTLDSAGNIYGTTYSGGTGNAGVVYKLSPSGQETVLYSFTGGADGGNPYAGLIIGPEGNLYGTAYQGGADNKGVVFRVFPGGQEQVLYSFTGGADGGNPYGGVIADGADLYGTTYSGGANNVGVVYKLNDSVSESVLYNFSGDGVSKPEFGMIRDSAGNLYGTAGGVVYEIEAGGTFEELASLPGPAASGVTRDATGNLYGVNGWNGFTNPSYGGVYEVDAAGKLTALYSFKGLTDGMNPYGDLILDPEGDLLGTTNGGGIDSGLIYKLSLSGQKTTLYSFPGAPGGTHPESPLTRDTAGNLYGTTAVGGEVSQGVVFKMDPAGNETVLYTFAGDAYSGTPVGSLALDSSGNIYGTLSGAIQSHSNFCAGPWAVASYTSSILPVMKPCYTLSPVGPMEAAPPA